jgi:hypothetical protein
MKTNVLKTARKALTILLALLAFAACGEKEIGGDEDSDRAIGFTPYTMPDNAFRSAGEWSNTTLEAMTVFAHYTGEADFDAVVSATTPNFMYNQLVTKSGNEWTYSPVKYWPVQNQKVSFFAVAPVPSTANGIELMETNDEYAGYPAFTVTPAPDPAEQADFCVATPVMNATYAGTGGKVHFSFAHAMAKMTFSAQYVSSETFGVVIGKIEINGLKLYGSNTLRITPSGFAWEAFPSGVEPVATDYALSIDDHTLRNTPLTQTLAPVSSDAGTLMLIPQTTPTGATIKVTLWVGDREEVRTGNMQLPLMLGAGKSYNYSLTISDSRMSGVLDKPDWDYAYTGDVQHFVAPVDGTYKFEVWGASGGNNGHSGRGGYSWGQLTLTQGELLYVYVGESGTTGKSGKSWNGGGEAGVRYSTPYWRGGGGTDFRTVGGEWNNAASLASRILVAGGGGGARLDNSGNTAYDGGAGGGIAGIGLGGTGGGGGGTQTAGGARGSSQNTYGAAGSFGAGGYGASNTYGCGGGGGGGWYGGGGSGANGSDPRKGGGGGSGYVAGIEGYGDVRYPPAKTFTSGESVAGNMADEMPNWNGGGMMTGHLGNGHARVTRVVGP